MINLLTKATGGAILPWVLLAIGAAYAAGTATGWSLKGDRVQAEAQADEAAALRSALATERAGREADSFWFQEQQDRIGVLEAANAEKIVEVQYRTRTVVQKVSESDAPVLSMSVPADIMFLRNCLRDPSHDPACRRADAAAGDGPAAPLDREGGKPADYTDQ